MELPLHSAIGTSSYKLGKFLVRKLCSVTYNEFTVKDYFASAEEIVHQDSKLFMYSLDFDSLFTYIPLEEIINIGIHYFASAEEIAHQDSKLFMYSLDFDSLFTYIPLEEIINIGIHYFASAEEIAHQDSKLFMYSLDFDSLLHTS